MAHAASLVRTLLVALLAAVLMLAPAQARTPAVVTTVTVTSWTAETDENESDDEAGSARRYAPSSALLDASRAGQDFGPFTVVAPHTARMTGDVTSHTPRQFAAMLAAFPAIRRLEMIDCPGSLDEEANLILARAIRRAGLETIVPSGGSVRSGAVELWLAGVKRAAAADAEFGVHSWIDENGHEAADYPANDPVHSEYLSYYREMGMDDARARAFYALTNSTPFDEVRYLTRDDMAQFVALD